MRLTTIGALALLLTAAGCPEDGGDDGGDEPCGNGVIDDGEKCDPGITSGEGACPADCPDDGDPCTEEVFSGSADDCSATCQASARGCADGDGCCPAACNANTDGDCDPVCNNGVTEGDETCDGDCPSECPSSDPCGPMELAGSAAECDAECVATAMPACGGSDSCCPDDCTSADDPDCLGAIGEPCTDHGRCASGTCGTADFFGMPGGYCTADCSTNPTVCGEGAHCQVGREGVRFCNKSCTQSADCREAEGYDCTDPDNDGSSECVPIATGSGAVGDACTLTTECAGGEAGICLAPVSATPGGYCSLTRCDPSSDTCPGGSHCGLVDSATGRGICVMNCGGGECARSHYSCYDADADGVDECWVAPTGSGVVGDPCVGSEACGGGEFYFCFTLWTGGYCSANCTAGEGISCPAGSHCYAFGEFGRCLKDCETIDQCRTGYACVDRDGVDGNECYDAG